MVDICEKEEKVDLHMYLILAFLHVTVLTRCCQIFMWYEQLPISTSHVFHPLSLRVNLSTEEIWNLF